MEGASLSDLESEDELQIDETPPPRRKPPGPSKKKKISGRNWTQNQLHLKPMVHNVYSYLKCSYLKTCLKVVECVTVI